MGEQRVEGQTASDFRGNIAGDMYVDAVNAQRFKCFESLEASEFVHPESSPGLLRIPNINVILGDNGVGKSAFMEAVVLAVLGQTLGGSGYRSLGAVRRDQSGVPHKDATLRATVRDSRVWKKALSLDATIRTKGHGEHIVAPPSTAQYAVEEILYADDDPRLFLCGYGTSRNTVEAGSFDPNIRNRQYSERLQRVGSVLLPEFSLVPLASWLPSSAAADEVIALLGSLSSTVEFLAEVERDELLVRFKGTNLPWSALSDGYRSFFGWIGDLIYRLSRVAGSQKLTDIPGVVLVDELDLHLHPKWQSEVVQALSRTFPRLQFILTTHSPLVVGALDAENITILEQDDDGVSIARRPDSSPWGLSAEQLLLNSEFGFDLDTARERTFDEQLDVKRREASTGDIDAAIELQRMLALGNEGRSPE